jgi:hypothetical protein
LQEGANGKPKIQIENKIENKKMVMNNYEGVLPFVFGWEQIHGSSKNGVV